MTTKEETIEDQRETSVAQRAEAMQGQRGGRMRSSMFLAAFPGWMFDGLETGISPVVARPALRKSNL